MEDMTTEDLLERYFAGHTTLAEEQELRRRFRGGGVPDHLAELDPLFAYWDAAARPVRRAHPRRRPARWLTTAAAVALLLVAARWWTAADPVALNDFPLAEAAAAPVDWTAHEVTDPTEALRLLRGALNTASTGLNHSGTVTLQRLHDAATQIR